MADFALEVVRLFCRGRLEIPSDASLLANGFERISVGIDHVRGIITRSVMRPKTGTPIVSPAGSQGFGVESIDRSVRRCVEREMKTRTGRLNGELLLFERENVPTSRRAISSRVGFRPDPGQPQRSKRGVVESNGALKIRDAERNMTQHALSIVARRCFAVGLKSAASRAPG
jgi:hypothetical protein